MPFKDINKRRENQRLRTRRYEAKNPEKRREWTRRTMANWRRKNAETYAEQNRARVAVHNAIERGLLTRPTACPRCLKSDQRIEAHHHNGYTREHAL